MSEFTENTNKPEIVRMSSAHFLLHAGSLLRRITSGENVEFHLMDAGISVEPAIDEIIGLADPDFQNSAFERAARGEIVVFAVGSKSYAMCRPLEDQYWPEATPEQLAPSA